jgi:hypothetical protein
MEILLFTGLLGFGLYLLCTETVDDIRRDLNINNKEQS